MDQRGALIAIAAIICSVGADAAVPSWANYFENGDTWGYIPTGTHIKFWDGGWGAEPYKMTLDEM